MDVVYIYVDKHPCLFGEESQLLPRAGEKFGARRRRHLLVFFAAGSARVLLQGECAWRWEHGTQVLTLLLTKFASVHSSAPL